MGRISIRSAKTKGRRLQQLIAADFSRITGISWGKDELIDSRQGCQSGVDVILIGEAKQLLDVAVEAKAQETWSIGPYLAQTRANQGDFSDHVLIAKQSRKDPIAIIDHDYLVKLAGEDAYIVASYSGTRLMLAKRVEEIRNLIGKRQEWAAHFAYWGEDMYFMEYSYYIKLLAKLVEERRNADIRI